MVPQKFRLFHTGYSRTTAHEADKTEKYKSEMSVRWAASFVASVKKLEGQRDRQCESYRQGLLKVRTARERVSHFLILRKIRTFESVNEI